MKYICLSFDDARADTYVFALPIIRKYKLHATVNVITDYIYNPENYSFSTADKAMTAEQLLEWQNAQNEVACHGHTHKNEPNDILCNIAELQKLGLKTNEIGFASPNSWLFEGNKNELGIAQLKTSGVISYMRSGTRIRREGRLYTLLSLVERYTHSRILFRYLNRRSLFKIHTPPEILPSVTVKDYTTLKQITDFIEKMEDDNGLILMFHSILPKESELFGCDHYYWDSSCFDDLCHYLYQHRTDVCVTTTIGLCKQTAAFSKRETLS